MELAALIAEFLKGITSWFPRPFLINVTERGVLFRRGCDPILLEPGFHWHTPLFSTYERFSVLRDATPFPAVCLPTKDDKHLAVGFVVVWHLKPEDVITAATTTGDLEAMVREVGESLLPAVVLSHSKHELAERIRGDNRKVTINSKLIRDAQDLLSPYGVTVEEKK
jgi:regulator of protease activity HflC (stomatin/prohibitin superfamily)